MTSFRSQDSPTRIPKRVHISKESHISKKSQLSKKKKKSQVTLLFFFS